MSESAMRVLIVQGDGARVPTLAADDAFGPFELQHCRGLIEATGALATERYAAIVFALTLIDARRLLTWPALSQAVAEPAVVVLTSESPGVDLALRLVEQGVQDVGSIADDRGGAGTLERTLRLAIGRKALELSARKAYGTDLMTGLPNQAQLTEHVSQLLAMREREPAPMVLLAVRIEGLATTEARLGRTAANALRRKVAVRLRVGLRAGDVVAALGPDLLGVLLPRVQDPHDAERVAAKLVLALKASFSLAGDEVTVAVAIGAAHYPRDGKDADLLLRRAIGLAAATQAVGRAGFADALERGTCLPDAANDAA